MPKQLIQTDGYKALVKKIQSELSELDFFIKRRTAEGYWRIGKFIHEHLLENKDRADYGQYLFERLGEDIDRDVSTLSRALKFYRLYPILAEPQELSWEHYRSLITVKDEAKRKLFAEKAAKKEWTSQELEEAIRLDRLKIEEPEVKTIQDSVKLSVTRARLYTYKVIEPQYLQSTEENVVVDVGFYINTQVPLKGIAKPKDGQIVESTKTASGYSFKASDAKPRELYTYKALVERVVDGDTIWVNIDCGFDIWIRQKLRLRSIDAPELDTIKGWEAKQFVEAVLSKVSFAVIKTHGSDKYDRYLTDIFYLKGQSNPQTVLEEGTFLNQDLLDRGLAKVMND